MGKRGVAYEKCANPRHARNRKSASFRRPRTMGRVLTARPGRCRPRQTDGPKANAYTMRYSRFWRPRVTTSPFLRYSGIRRPAAVLTAVPSFGFRFKRFLMRHWTPPGTSRRGQQNDLRPSPPQRSVRYARCDIITMRFTITRRRCRCCCCYCRCQRKRFTAIPVTAGGRWNRITPRVRTHPQISGVLSTISRGGGGKHVFIRKT